MVKRFFIKLPLFLLVLAAFISCAKEEPVQFIISANGSTLFARSRTAQEGTLDFSKNKKLEYRFDNSFVLKPNSSIEIEYGFVTPVYSIEILETLSPVVEMGNVSQSLPLGVSRIRYSFPVEDYFTGKFNIRLWEREKGKIKKEDVPVIKIYSFRIIERWFGFDYTTEDLPNYTSYKMAALGNYYAFNVPDNYIPNKELVEIRAVFSGAPAVLEFNGRKIQTLPGAETLYIPPLLFPVTGQVSIKSEKVWSLSITPLIEAPVFPSPITADPVLIINWPKQNWRNKDYEVFRWEHFPSLLIFDFANYDIQDRMLKRLAFFVEKAGFRGRLAPDGEIAGLHAWNAHDYKADDLAAFFALARKTNFPLLDEEKQLEKILLEQKIIREDASANMAGGITAGDGGIISISKESDEYLRYRFMAHEGFHGIFFIDEEFRAFSRQRWGKFPPVAKRFLISFFEFQQYDVKDEYLLINEFMAHILQQSTSGAADYFGKYLPPRLENTWRASALPPKDEASGTWPALSQAFTAEAEAFSAYVNQRWNLSAGRVWTLRVE